MMGDSGTSIPRSYARGWGARRWIKPPSKSMLVKYPLRLESPWQPAVRSLLSVFFFFFLLSAAVEGGSPRVHLWARDGFWLHAGPFVA